MPDALSTEYINSTDYTTVEPKLTNLKEILDGLAAEQETNRKLRYAEVDIEAERKKGSLQPDELYIPLHIVDTNIKREQSPYVQYVAQSPRAVICKDLDDPTVDLDLLDKDLTNKLRYDGWQLSMFAAIDAFQSHGYSVLEVILDLTAPGELSHEHVSYGDFGFISDTKDIQAAEYVIRRYYYTRTSLLALCVDGPEGFSREQVDKIIGKEPSNETAQSINYKDKSLYEVYKVMFRVNGIVHVAWCCPNTCDNWLRAPRPLYLGRRKPSAAPTIEQTMQAQMTGLPITEEDYEVKYPYVIFQYLISENDTLSESKGRIFLDQDIQEAVSSLTSSTVTQARRAAGMYFSKDVSDPNDDLMLQKNIFFKNGCVLNSKVAAFKLDAPDPGMFSAINVLVTANQNETSQVNFAVNNRKDSRKTATEVQTANQQQQILSTVQVVLFSLSLAQTYRLMASIIKSRVLAGLLTVNQNLLALYGRRFSVKPSGDVDVIERQQLIQSMVNSWPVIQNTAASVVFLCDLIELMFPERAAKYVAAIQQAQVQQQSQQNQMMQQGLALAKQMSDGIIQLSKKPEMFSETGKIHALPVLEQAATQLENIQKQTRQ